MTTTADTTAPTMTAVLLFGEDVAFEEVGSGAYKNRLNITTLGYFI